MGTTPQFIATPRLGMGQVTVANTNRDGTTGTYVDILAGHANTTRVSEVIIEAAGTTTAGVVRLFLYDGTNVRLWDEILIAAATPSTTVAAIRARRTYDTLYLPSASWVLRASTHNAETFNVFALGGNL